jgi:hypothetical protein
MFVPVLESETPEEPEKELSELKERSIGVAVATTKQGEPEAPCNEHPSDDPVRKVHLFLRSNLALM